MRELKQAACALHECFDWNCNDIEPGAPISSPCSPTSRSDERLVLTDEQKAIVDNEADRRVVIADAGTAKTTVMVEAMARDIERGIPPSQILAQTFSRVGAGVMNDRLLSRVPGSGSATVSTIHAFCLTLVREALAEFGFKRPPEMLKEKDQTRIFRRELEKAGVTDPKSPLQFSAAYSWARNNRLEIVEIAQKLPIEQATIEAVSRAYAAEKSRYGRLDFDDLLVLIFKKIESCEAFRAKLAIRYPNIYVDEAQDTSLLQWQILLPIASRIFAVGDPKQSIYSWRGGIGDFASLIPKATQFTLHQNFRSTPQILAVANSIHDSGIFSRFADGPKPVLLGFEDAVDEAVEVARIARSFTSGSIAILATNWEQLELVRLALCLEGMKVDYGSDTPVFDRALIQKFLAQLMWAFGDRSEDGWNSFLKTLGLNNGWAGQIPSELGLFSHAADFLPLTRAQRDLLDAVENMGLGGRGESEGIACFYENFFRDNFDRAGRIEMSVRVLSRLATSKDELRALMIEREIGPPVTVSTIHGQKGAEYDTVFLIGLNEGSLPLWNTDNFEEERNLFYVGVTRPKRNLFLTRPFVDECGRDRDRSTFLDELHLDLFSFDPPKTQALLEAE